MILARIAQLLLLAGLIVGTWWIGARNVDAQICVLFATGAAVLCAAISVNVAFEKGLESSRGAIGVCVLMMAFLTLQVVQCVNPAFIVQMEGLYWRRLSLPHLAGFPSGFEARFDRASKLDISFTNPLRHLIVFAAAFSATVAAFILARWDHLRRGIFWSLVAQTAVVSLFSIVHRLSGSTKTLFFHEEVEFWMGSPVFPYKNAAAAYQVLLLGICLAMFAQVRSRGGRNQALLWSVGLTAGLALVALFLLNSRAGVAMGGILALCASYGEGFARKANGAQGTLRGLRMLTVAVLVGGGCWLLLRGGFANTLRRFDAELRQPLVLLRGGEPRIQKQQVAIEMVKDQPWFGWGGGAYVYLFLDYHPRVPAYLRDLLRAQPDRNRIYETSADGDWWEFLVEYGVVGSALLAMSMILAVWLWIRAEGQRCAPSVYLMLSAVLVALHGIIDRILREEIVLMLLGITFALAIRVAQAHREHLGAGGRSIR